MPRLTLTLGLTAILFNNTFEFTLGECINDEGGNFSLTEIHLHTGLSLVLGSVYTPNQDKQDFIISLIEAIQNFENPNILLAGDWNTTRNFQLDNENYVSQNNLKMTQEIQNMMQTFSLRDVWRVNNPKKNSSLGHKDYPINKQG